jgi:hypothetical protein
VVSIVEPLPILRLLLRPCPEFIEGTGFGFDIEDKQTEISTRIEVDLPKVEDKKI